MAQQGGAVFWEQLGCHVFCHLGDHVHPLGVSKAANTIVNTGIRENDPLGTVHLNQSTTVEYMISSQGGTYLEDSEYRKLSDKK